MSDDAMTPEQREKYDALMKALREWTATLRAERDQLRAEQAELMAKLGVH